MISKKFQLIKEDWLKIGKGFKIAIGGALAIGLISFFTSLPSLLDVSVYGAFTVAIIGAICATLINLLNKYISSTQYPPEI